jgi:hypothetical protein
MGLEHHGDQLDRLRHGRPQPSLRHSTQIRLADRDEVGTPELDARQLVGERPPLIDLHSVDKRPPGPMVVERAQHEPPRLHSIDAERTAAEQVAAGRSHDDRESSVRQFPRQIRMRPIGLDDDRFARRPDSPCGLTRAEHGRHLRRLQR